jgi:metal transporter CNNM
LDKIGLKIVINGDDPELARQANIIAPVRDNGNLLLCTLLLGNVAVNAYLSILMSDLTSGTVGFLLSTILIVIFGEIIPQALCSRNALYIGSLAVPLVKVIMFLLYPFTKPLSIALDWLLGEEIGTIHSRQGLQELLKIHVQHGAMNEEAGRVTQGALNYQDLDVGKVMTQLSDVFMLSASDNLNFKKITEIFKCGYSRIPVYEKDRTDIIGLIFVKDLIFVDPQDDTPVRNFIQIFSRSYHLVWPDQKLGDVLRLFKRGKSHIAIVRDVNQNEGNGDPFYEVKGVITLEDILEEIIGDEIMDETDDRVTNDGDSITNSNSGVERVGHSDFDYEKLRLLDTGKLEYEQLSENEANAIGSHLRTNIKQFRGLEVTEIMMDRLLDGCPVHDIARITSEDSNTHHTDDFLFSNGVEIDEMVLVITGKLIVLAGRDEYRSEAGPWSVIGAEAMVSDAAYIPDYSAYISTEELRCIRITREQWQKAMGGEYVWQSYGSSYVPKESRKRLTSKSTIFKASFDEIVIQEKNSSKSIETFEIDIETGRGDDNNNNNNKEIIKKKSVGKEYQKI